MKKHPNHPPASPVAFGAIMTWIAQAMAYHGDPASQQEPDLRLLTDHGLPQGSIRKAEARRDAETGIPLISMTFRKPKVRMEMSSETSANGKPYLFDPAGAALVRMLLLFGGPMYEDAKTSGKIHELQYGEAGRSLLRIITGAGVGETVVENSTNHRDLRRGGLMKQSHGRGRLSARDEAIRIALNTFERNAAKAHLPMTSEHYEWLHRRLFDLIDTVPMRGNPISAE